MLWRTIRPIGLGRTSLRLLRPFRGLDRRIQHRFGMAPAARFRPSERILETPVSGHWDGTGRFAYLGVEQDLGFPPDWSAAPSRLWGYHLHYLDDLRDSEVDPNDRLRLLRAWVEGNPFGSGPGWESFPTSIRLVNALEFLAATGVVPEDGISRSLGAQAWWMERNLETDVGANHLWKNVVALCWAGRLLDASPARRWKARGDRLAARELAAQVLPDGFHYERTPGYHAILVDDLLRLSGLLDSCGDGDTDFAHLVRKTRAAAARSLAAVLHRDGEIPLFNDSALGQAPPSGPLLDRCGVPIPERSSGLPEAGLHRFDGTGSTLILDAGETASPAQPGHAHADTLSYELSYHGRRIVVDAGVYDYGASPERRYARSTAAHNTVVVDGTDQSEMWGVFRVGRRASPRNVRRIEHGIEAGHDGYDHLPGRPEHRRAVTFQSPDTWHVEDTISGAGEHTATGRVRFHPDLDVHAHPDGTVEAAGESIRCLLRPGENTSLSLEEGWYFPRFGEKHECTVVRMDAAGRPPFHFSYRLELSTRD